MGNKELRRLKRRDLLQMLLAQCEETERLQKELDETRTELETLQEGYADMGKAFRKPGCGIGLKGLHPVRSSGIFLSRLSQWAHRSNIQSAGTGRIRFSHPLRTASGFPSGFRGFPPYKDQARWK